MGHVKNGAAWAIATILLLFAAGRSIFPGWATARAGENPPGKKLPGQWIQVDTTAFDLPAAGGGLNTIWGTSATDIYVGGREGFVLHYDGRKWREVETETKNDVIQIVGASRKDVYLLTEGDNGMGLTREHGYVPPRQTSTDTPVWTPYLFRLDGGKFVPFSIKQDTAGWWHAQKGIWAASKNDLFIACADGGEILHFDGQNISRVYGYFSGLPWGRRPDQIKGDELRLNAIWGAPPENIYAVGRDAARHVAIVRFDGKTWARESVPETYGLPIISASSAKDIWASLLHFDGVKWSLKSGPKDGWGLVSLWTSGPAAVFGVAAGRVYFFDGIEWSIVYETMKNRLLGIWGSSPSDVWAVGDGGTILHYAGK
jgi:hypothetical protein